jgi:hypothetical protein
VLEAQEEGEEGRLGSGQEEEVQEEEEAEVAVAR